MKTIGITGGVITQGDSTLSGTSAYKMEASLGNNII